MRWVSALGAATLAAAGCTYPSFQFDTGGAGGGSTTSSSSGTKASSTGSSVTTSGTGACPVGNLLISQIRSRGVNGADDEFVELYNPTRASVTLDPTWTLQARSTSASGYDVRWKGTGATIPSYRHYLIVGSAYVQEPAADGHDSLGITDAGSLILVQGTNDVDAVCYAYDLGTASILVNPFNSYVCNGTPAANPHDDNVDTNADASIERKPGGSAGNCTDTGDNFSDFALQVPATPNDLASPPQP